MMLKKIILAGLLLNCCLIFTGKAEERATYKIKLNNGKELFVFWNERKEQGNKVDVEFDTPWNPHFEPVYKNMLSKDAPERELPNARKARINKGWEDAGYKEANNGKYYPADEVRLAQEARTMAEAGDVKIAVKEPVQETEPPKIMNEGEVTTLQTRGGFSQWIRHMGIIVVACVLIAGIYWGFIRPRE